MTLEHATGIFEIDTKPFGCAEIVASFLVKGTDGTAIIDPGFPSSTKTVVNELRNIGVDPEGIDYIILTHTHIDHAGAAGLLAKIAEGAQVLTHKRGVFYLKNSAKIRGGATMVFGHELSDKFGEPTDIQDQRIVSVSHGEAIDLGDKTLRVYHTPGHSGDHISLFEEATGTLFPGDTACLHYPQLDHVLIPAGSPPIYRTDYIVEELQRLTDLNVERILTPHFGQANSGPSVFMARNIESVQDSRRRIEKMLTEGLEFSQVVEKLRAGIIEQSGRPRSDIPDFMADVWLRAMLKTGLMGYMADILQYARDIRPFSENISARG